MVLGTSKVPAAAPVVISSLKKGISLEFPGCVAHYFKAFINIRTVLNLHQQDGPSEDLHCEDTKEGRSLGDGCNCHFRCDLAWQDFLTFVCGWHCFRGRVCICHGPACNPCPACLTIIWLQSSARCHATPPIGQVCLRCSAPEHIGSTQLLEEHARAGQSRPV
jgi:hypothetical protein